MSAIWEAYFREGLFYLFIYLFIEFGGGGGAGGVGGALALRRLAGYPKDRFSGITTRKAFAQIIPPTTQVTWHPTYRRNFKTEK